MFFVSKKEKRKGALVAWGWMLGWGWILVAWGVDQLIKGIVIAVGLDYYLCTHVKICILYTKQIISWICIFIKYVTSVSSIVTPLN